MKLTKHKKYKNFYECQEFSDIRKYILKSSPESRKNFRNVGKSKQKILNNGNNKELNKTHINVKCPYTHTAFLL